MKFFARRILCIAVLVAGATSTYAVDQVTPYESLSAGDLVTDALMIGRRFLALPSGQWQLISRSARPTSADGANKLGDMVTLVFQEIASGRVRRTLEIGATVYSSRVNWLDEPCKNKGDSYWLEDMKTGINNQFCIRIGFTSGFVEDARGETFQRWANDIKTKGIGFSREMPYVLITKYTRSDFLRMKIQFDPALASITDSESLSRPLNAWNPRNIAPDTERAKFYAALKSWAPQFASACARAFEGDTSLRPADFGDPVFSSH